MGGGRGGPVESAVGRCCPNHGAEDMASDIFGDCTHVGTICSQIRSKANTRDFFYFFLKISNLKFWPSLTDIRSRFVVKS